MCRTELSLYEVCHEKTDLKVFDILSRATSHGAPWLRWPEDGEEGNGGTPSPGVIALLTHADYPLHLNPLGLLNY